MKIRFDINAPRVDGIRISDLEIKDIDWMIDGIIDDPVKLRAVLEQIMICDGSAPASILGYYLDDTKEYRSLFCPLGYPLYEKIGHKMRENPKVLDIAIETGLVCGAIRTHMGCALDVWENWDCMKTGILRILADPHLKVFIEHRERVYIENLADVEVEDDWYNIVDQLQKEFSHSEFKGY